MSQQAPRPDDLIWFFEKLNDQDNRRTQTLDAVMALVEGLAATLPPDARLSVMARAQNLCSDAVRTEAWRIAEKISQAGWFRTFDGDWQHGVRADRRRGQP
jgi:hypothetical protein